MIGRVPIGLARSDESVADDVGIVVVACTVARSIGRSILVGSIRQNGQGQHDAVPAAVVVAADARHHRGDFGSGGPTTSQIASAAPSKDGTGIAGGSSTTACSSFVVVNTADTAEEAPTAATTATAWGCTPTAQEGGAVQDAAAASVGRRGGHGGWSGN